MKNYARNSFRMAERDKSNGEIIAKVVVNSANTKFFRLRLVRNKNMIRFSILFWAEP